MPNFSFLACLELARLVDLLLHVKPGFASVGGTNLVKSANIKRKINNISDSDLLIFHLRRQLRERESPTVCKFN